MKKIKKRSSCAISSALDIIGDKWALLIVRDMMFHDKNTYGDFHKCAEKIATNVLADKLVLLESSGIIEKKKHPESKVKYLYKLTQKGIDLLPVLMEIILWSDKHLDISENGKAVAKKIREDKKGMLKKYLENIS